ncbi:hypothetical protein [Pseudomonas sp. L13]|uniref:hypothetical protein n=1 Tax=Pseudomonas sp. L13 TaxID=343985 RepID=UPI00137B8395|nr:hypothetical protein [Pseudomonas sp. L13]NCE92260.1 hypothetical protein [Pseudomonas sp. L13]
MAASMVDGCGAFYALVCLADSAVRGELYLEVNCFFAAHSKLGIVVWLRYLSMSDAVHVIGFRSANKREVKIKTKKPIPERVDTVNPEWSAEDFAKAKLASEVLKGLFGEAQAKKMLNPSRRGQVGSHHRARQCSF